MKRIRDKIREDLKKGRKYEDLFVKMAGGEWERSSIEVDMEQHWDVKSLKTGATFDVKGFKTNNYVTIEFKNVKGNKGWLYGQADFIAFYLHDRFYIVDREELVELAESMVLRQAPVVTGQSYTSFPMYTPYRRKNRKDIIAKLKDYDIMRIAKHIIT